MAEPALALQPTDPDSPRGRLMRGAAQLFRTKGFDRTTVRDIAAEVGIQSGSIFHHFRSKDDILRAVMEESVCNLIRRIQQALEGLESPRDRLRAMIRCELEALRGDQGDALAVLVYEWRSLSESGQKSLLEGRDAYEKLWQTEMNGAGSLLRQGVDPFILRRFVHGALYWTTHWYQDDGQLGLDQLTDMAMPMLFQDP
ncbi:TetR/AcrR family transcriptional regulator [Spongorhabdus nitratireducens]